jgi:hypothetical protein
LVIVADTSNSLEDADYQKLQDMLRVYMFEFTSHVELLKVGFITYGSNADVAVPLGEFAHANNFVDKIEQADRSTGTADARLGLDSALQQFEDFGREDAAKVVLLFSNGHSV